MYKLRLFRSRKEEEARASKMHALITVGRYLLCQREYRLSIEVLKETLQLLQACTHSRSDIYIEALELLSWSCANADPSQSEIEFQDVFDILDMLTSTLQHYYPLRASRVHSFVEFLVKLDKRPDQLMSFKRVVYRLVHSQVTFEDGWTLLHHAVEECCFYQGCMGVIELLLECGADVNALDRGNNTALHVCTQPCPNAPMYPNQKEQVIKLLLRYSAHIDIVNVSGDLAAKNLSLNILGHVNLQCLSASVIRDRQIPYVGEIPVHLESFVQMHGGRLIFRGRGLEDKKPGLSLVSLGFELLGLAGPCIGLVLVVVGLGLVKCGLKLRGLSRPGA